MRGSTDRIHNQEYAPPPYALVPGPTRCCYRQLGFFHDVFRTPFEVFAYGSLIGSALLNGVLFVALIPLFLLQTISPVQ